MQKQYLLDENDIKDAVQFWVSTKFKPQTMLETKIECVETKISEDEITYKPVITVIEKD